MKTATVMFYNVVAKWAEGPQIVFTHPDPVRCAKYVEEWDDNQNGYPYHGLHVETETATGTVISEAN